jgi:hypothetical protein
LPRLGVARKLSRDLLIALPWFGVRRGSLLALAGVLEGVAGVGFIFLADRNSAGWLFSLSDTSSIFSSLRFVLAVATVASLGRTIRILPVDVGPGRWLDVEQVNKDGCLPKLMGRPDSKENWRGFETTSPPNSSRREGEVLGEFPSPGRIERSAASFSVG